MSVGRSVSPSVTGSFHLCISKIAVSICLKRTLTTPTTFSSSSTTSTGVEEASLFLIEHVSLTHSILSSPSSITIHQVKVVEEEKEDLETMMKKKAIELEALDAKVIDAIVNRTAELFDKKVAVLAEDLQRKIDESVKQPEVVVASNVPATENGSLGAAATSDAIRTTGSAVTSDANATKEHMVFVGMNGEKNLITKSDASNTNAETNGAGKNETKAALVSKTGELT